LVLRLSAVLLDDLLVLFWSLRLIHCEAISLPDWKKHYRKATKWLGKRLIDGISLLYLVLVCGGRLSRIMCFWIYCLLFDTIIVLVGVVALLSFPSSTGEGRILDWNCRANSLGNLILFGGGLAFGEGCVQSYRISRVDWVRSLRYWKNQLFSYFMMIIVASVKLPNWGYIQCGYGFRAFCRFWLGCFKIGLHPFGLMIGATIARCELCFYASCGHSA